MFELKTLYSVPEIFEPLVFNDGFNLIIGETSKGSKKTNGVGKSIAVEFISFCLLKKASSSRVMKIPSEELPKNTFVILDIIVNGVNVTIQRNISNPNKPKLIVDGVLFDYSSCDEALEYLSSLLYCNSDRIVTPSFRSILGPLMRDEGSEFKSIEGFYDTNLKIPSDYTPILHLLGIDPEPYKNVKLWSKEVQALNTSKKKTKESIISLTNKSLEECRSVLNELSYQLSEVKSHIENFETAESHEYITAEIEQVETQLSSLKTRKSIIKSELSKIDLFKGDNYIDDSEIIDFYNRFKSGLGDYITKDLEEVVSFKHKIDTFQRNLLKERKDSLEKELLDIKAKITSTGELYKRAVSILSQQGSFRNIKEVMAVYEHIHYQYASLYSLLQKFDQHTFDIDMAKSKRTDNVRFLSTAINDAKEITKSFEQTILGLHKDIYGNMRSSFDISANESAAVVKLDLRIDSDGSHSINREKVFIFDIALLMNKETSKFHPGLLVHDNIFDVDQVTLINSLNAIYKLDRNLRFAGKQYILTLNRDKLSADDLTQLDFQLEKFTIANLTRENRFLKFDYLEV